MWILTKSMGLATIALGVLIVGSSVMARHHKANDHDHHVHSESVEHANYTNHVHSAVFSDDTITKTFKVDEGGMLTIDTDRGIIHVESGKSDEVEIVIEREAKSESARKYIEQLEFSFDQDGNSVRVDGEWKGERMKKWNSWRSGLKIKITAHVPNRFNLNAKTSGGSIAVSDLDGDVEVRTSGGSLKLGDIQGTVVGHTSGGSITLEGGGGTADLSTSGGSITLGEVNGEVNATTSGGSIRIDRAQGSVDASTSGGSVVVNEVMGTVNASTSGGSITATITEQPTDDCRLTTSGGSVNVKLASGLRFDLDAKTSSGSRLRSDFDITSSGTIKKNEVRGSVNGGGPLLYLRTSGGGINVNQI